jgi:hypothetical protein
MVAEKAKISLLTNYIGFSDKLKTEVPQTRQHTDQKLPLKSFFRVCF